MHRDSGFVVRLEVVERGRRRRWSVAEKLRIVEERLAGHGQAAAFIRTVVVAGEADALAAASPAGGRIEIVVADGRRVIVGSDVDAAALGRVLDVLERR